MDSRDHFDKENNFDIGAAVHLLLRFQLFDHLAAALGYEADNDRVTAPRLPLQHNIPQKLQKVSFYLFSRMPTFLTGTTQVVDELADWTMPIRKMQQNFPNLNASTLLSNLSTTQQLQKLGITVMANKGRDSVVLEQQLIALSRVVTYSNVANVNNVFGNIELLSFAVVWFSKLGWGAPDTTEGLQSVMKQ